MLRVEKRYLPSLRMRGLKMFLGLKEKRDRVKDEAEN